MAMEDMAEPILTPPIRPTLEKLVLKQDGTTETITRTESSSVFKMEVEDYISDNKVYRTKKERWEETVQGHTILSYSTALPSWRLGSLPRQTGIWFEQTVMLWVC